jgi:hypothetical protein
MRAGLWAYEGQRRARQARGAVHARATSSGGCKELRARSKNGWRPERRVRLLGLRRPFCDPLAFTTGSVSSHRRRSNASLSRVARRCRLSANVLRRRLCAGIAHGRQYNMHITGNRHRIVEERRDACRQALSTGQAPWLRRLRNANAKLPLTCSDRKSVSSGPLHRIPTTRMLEHLKSPSTPSRLQHMKSPEAA